MRPQVLMNSNHLHNEDCLRTKPKLFVLSMDSPELLAIDIQRCIYQFRGRRVVLDSDLARFYEISTKRMNEQVKRNALRFPADFRFLLNHTEFENLKKYSVYIKESTYGGRRHPPYAFTEHGVTMLAGVLNSQKAIETNLAIIRAFLSLEERSSIQLDIDNRLEQLEKQNDLILNALLNSRINCSDSKERGIEPPYFSGKKEKLIEIAETTAHYFKLRLQDLRSQNRRPQISLPRQIAIFLIRKRLQAGYAEIAAYFKLKNHTTVMYACKKIETSEKIRDHFQIHVEKIELILNKNSTKTIDFFKESKK